jgi:hypothetical protein
MKSVVGSFMRRRSPKIQAVGAVLAEGSALNVLLLRLSPLVPNNVMSALLALSPLSPFLCISLSLIGWIPSTVFTLWTAAIIRQSIDGWCLGDEEEGEGEGGGDTSLGQIIVFYVIGPLATLAFIVFSSRLAKKKLNIILAEQAEAAAREEARSLSRRREGESDDDGEYSEDGYATSSEEEEDEQRVEAAAVLSLASSAAAAVDAGAHGGSRVGRSSGVGERRHGRRSARRSARRSRSRSRRRRHHSIVQ